MLISVGCQPRPMTTPSTPPPAPQTVQPEPSARAPGDPIVDLASQSFHTCARRQSGKVQCWGRNTYGQLGDGTRTNTKRMVSVLGLADATQVVTGRDFSCALRKAGTVVCWGNNEDGQLGDGRGAKLKAKSLRPVNVAKLGRVTQLVSGDWHVCALEATGTVWCWGNGDNGQIGRDSARAFASPIAIEQLGKVEQIVSGAHHVCALQVDGRVKCWGRNTEGQLGDGKSGSKIKPVFVTGLAGVQAIFSGHTFSCAQLENAAVRCWGDNKTSQLGPNGGRDPKWNAPIPFPDLTGVSRLVGGEAHGCVLGPTTRVRCWGSNDGGRAVGKGSGVVPRPTPVRGVGNAVAVAAGARHTCAVDAQGEVACWGLSVDDAVGSYRLASAARALVVRVMDFPARTVSSDRWSAPW